MELKDFVKDVALKLNRNNVDAFKRRAASLIMNIDELSADEISKMLNTNNTYEKALFTVGGDVKVLNKAVKIMMKGTDHYLSFALEYYKKHKSSFKWMNTITKNWVSSNIKFETMGADVLMYYLDNKNSFIYADDTISNDFQLIIDAKDKKLITAVVTHKNFKLIPSHYPMESLLSNNKYSYFLNDNIFDIVFPVMINIINKSGRDFTEGCASIIRSEYLKMKHISLLNTEQEIEMYEYMMAHNIKVSDDIMKYFYEITNDENLLPPEAKDVFLF